MSSKKKSRNSRPLTKTTKRSLAKSSESKKSVAENLAPAIYWMNDTMEDGPFDFNEKLKPQGKLIRRQFREAAEGKPGALEELRVSVRQQGDQLAMDASESVLGSIVRFYSTFNTNSWKALLPLVSSDNIFYAGKAARVLIVVHPEGVVAGAREVVAEIAKRFNYMNLADQSNNDDKQLATAVILRGILMLGDIQLITAVNQLATYLSKEQIFLVIVEDYDNGEEFIIQPNTLVIEFVLSCVEKEDPDSDAYTGWLLFLVLIPNAHAGKICLEIYEYPRGRIAPLVSFISYPEWVVHNQLRIRNISYREAGKHHDSGVAHVFNKWSEIKRTKPSKKQLAWQIILNCAEGLAIRAGKSPPFKW